MGVCLAGPLLLLVMTGIPLQFTAWLGLGSAGVPYAWVHRAYGIVPPEQGLGVAHVQQFGERIFLPSRSVRVNGSFLGGDELDAVWLAGTTQEILLVPKDSSAPLERNSLPVIAHRMGLSADLQLVIATDQGLWLSSDLGARWSQLEVPPDVVWWQPAVVPVSPVLAQRFGADYLSWERWLQDLHSGRFFGSVGVWVMNIASFVFIGLGFTGLVLWYSSRRSRS